MAMSGFICHDDYLQKTAKLTDEEVGRLFRSLMRYHATGIAEEIDGRESIAFDFIREDIDRATAAYRAKCEQNRNNRISALNNERQQSLTVVDVPVQKEQESKEVKKNNKNHFTPPTVEEVAAYCRERNNGIDAEYFVDYQTARDWVLSNGKRMRDWKATVRTWEKNGFNRKGGKPGKTVSAQQYAQRDYSDENNDDVYRKLGL